MENKDTYTPEEVARIARLYSEYQDSVRQTGASPTGSNDRRSYAKKALQIINEIPLNIRERFRMTQDTQDNIYRSLDWLVEQAK